MQFAIEYKEKEPRTHMFFSSAARTLLAIEDMGVGNVGLVLDLGHSLFAKETFVEGDDERRVGIAPARIGNSHLVRLRRYAIGRQNPTN